MNRKSAFSFMDALKSDQDLQKLAYQTLAQCTTTEQLQRIQTGLQIPSYRINFRFEDGSYYADITKSAVKYMDSIQLDTAENFDKVSGLQIASIVVEAIGLLLSVIGFTVPKGKMGEIARKVWKQISESSAIKKAVEAVKRVFSSGGSVSSKFSAVWDLLEAVWNYRKNGLIFFNIVKLFFSNLNIAEAAALFIKLTALMVSSLASAGIAFVADFIVALMSAYEFIVKVMNLTELDKIRAAVKV